jgi:membrane fusion protein (multidrug efflux system)
MTKRIVFAVIGLTLVAVVVLRILQATAESEVDPDVDEIRRVAGIPVEVARAEVAPLVVRRQFTGVLRGIRSATVRARTGDEIIEIPVHVGQRVRAGAVMVRQSSRGSAAAVRQAEAAWEQSNRRVERLRPLRAEGAVSDQDWDDAVTALAVAEANLAAARRSVVLTSPIDGVVTDILQTQGTFPESGDPLVRVSDLSGLQVTFQVSTRQARELALGQRAELPDFGLAGQVSRVALQADPETRLLEIEITFPGSGNATSALELVPGSLVTAEVVVGSRDTALLVPRIAVRDTAVWVIDDEAIAHKRSVALGLAGDRMIEVLDGLSAGELVVVAGASLLSDGAKARIVGGPGAPDER